MAFFKLWFVIWYSIDCFDHQAHCEKEQIIPTNRHCNNWKIRAEDNICPSLVHDDGYNHNRDRYPCYNTHIGFVQNVVKEEHIQYRY